MAAFVGVYAAVKIANPQPAVSPGEMVYDVRREDFDRRRPAVQRGRLRALLSWIFV